MGRSRKLPAGIDWAPRVPGRRCRWEERQGRIVLLVPRFGSGWFGRWMERRFSPRPYRVHLDDFGTFVWQRLDGVRTVEQIGREMRGAFGTRAEPVPHRLTTFLSRLQRGRFITWEE